MDYIHVPGTHVNMNIKTDIDWSFLGLVVSMIDHF
jgi:hypothetical protein